MDIRVKYHLTGALFWVALSWVVLPLMLVFGVLPFKSVVQPQSHWVFEWNESQGWVQQGLIQEEDLTVPLVTKKGYWVVQVATFQTMKRAELLRRELKEKGFQSAVVEIPKQDAVLFAVRVGPMDEKSKAESEKQALQRRMGLMPMLMFISTQSDGV